MSYILFWGIYPQWTKNFTSDKEAADSAYQYANTIGCGKVEEFKLIKQVPIKIEKQPE